MFQKRFSWFSIVRFPIRKQKPLASCAALTWEFAQLLKPSSPNWMSSLKNMDLIGWSIRQLLPTEQQPCNALLIELTEKLKTFSLTVFQPIFWGNLSVTDRSVLKWLKKLRSRWQWCSRDRNLRDRDLAETSRPRPRPESSRPRLETAHFSDGN